ncbi:MAG: 16S rRNA (adenine(1518)-N(6)/adenine(1519)-N(6))-dimethyltransferase RsmA [Deltaproteobacteria bacterium]|nr:16S rRNA (adenine(1518)-N(6)/adenine(1519)-N(6))-dimethyltransferase RsmA [Deltaproteobacteria bacterium]
MAAAESLHRRTREGLAALGVRPRRRLGQSFLVDPRVVARIVAEANVAGRTVVEIGPGLGALSEALAEGAARLDLVEIETRLAERLREQFRGRPQVRVLAADALRVDYEALVGAGPRALVVANLPYSVGSQILLRLIEARAGFERLVVMLQREVAERLVARPGSKAYGTITLWTALYGRAELLFRVSPAAFVPRPKIESAVVSIALDVEPRVALADEQHFRTVVRAAFAQRRKMLRAALARLATPGEIEAAGIDPRRRGETLSIEEFARLSNELRRARH